MFAGVSAAYQIYNNASSLGMTRQANGNISSIVPGDMIVHGQGTSSDVGHVAVVDYVASDGVHVVEQNYNGSAHRAMYGFSSGTLSRKLYDSSGYVMPILGVVHSPNNSNTNGSPPPPPPTPYDPKLRAAPHLSADFTGDRKPDIAVLYDYGNNDTALLVFRNTGSGFAALSPVAQNDDVGPG